MSGIIDFPTIPPTVASPANLEDTPCQNISRPNRNTTIDQLTLELLMNKRQYRKYIEQNDSSEFDKKKEEWERYTKYKPQITKLIHELLNDYSIAGNSEHLGNVDIQNTFHDLLQHCVYLFETRDYSNSPDEDTMFPPENAKQSTTAFSAPFANHYTNGNSFWGKNISKTSGKSKFAGDAT